MCARELNKVFNKSINLENPLKYGRQNFNLSATYKLTKFFNPYLQYQKYFSI